MGSRRQAKRRGWLAGAPGRLVTVKGHNESFPLSWGQVMPNRQGAQRSNAAFLLMLSIGSLLTLAGLFVTPAQGVTLLPGDIVITAEIGSENNLGLLRIDPVTGDRTVISDNTRGAGPVFNAPQAVAPASDGSLWVVDQIQGIVRVDPSTGDRSRFKGGLLEVDIVQVGDLLVVSRITGPTLAAYNVMTGSPRLVIGSGVGSGPTLGSYGGLAVSDNYLYASGNTSFSPGGEGILKVDLATGERTLVTGNSTTSAAVVGSGPFPFKPLDIAFEPNGNLLATSANLGAVIRIDDVTGDRTIVSTYEENPSTGSRFYGIAVEELGRILLAGKFPQGAVMAVDPVSGAQSILSDNSHGAGPAILNAIGIIVVANVPEPGSAALAVTGMMLLIPFRKKCFRVHRA